MPIQPIVPEVPQNPLAPFLSAATAAAAINYRTKQLQEQMLKMEMQNSFQQGRLDIMAENAKSLDLSRQAAASLKEQGLDLTAQRVQLKADELRLKGERDAAYLADKREKLKKDMFGLFTEERVRYRGQKGAVLPQDAFENTDIQTGATDTPGWHTDPKKPGKVYYNVPMFDKTTGKQAGVDPITIDKTDFDRLDRIFKGYKESTDSRVITYGDVNQMQQREAPPPDQPKVLDANTAKGFLQQAGGDKAAARELARQAGYTF